MRAVVTVETDVRFPQNGVKLFPVNLSKKNNSSGEPVWIFHVHCRHHYLVDDTAHFQKPTSMFTSKFAVWNVPNEIIYEYGVRTSMYDISKHTCINLYNGWNTYIVLKAMAITNTKYINLNDCIFLVPVVNWISGISVSIYFRITYDRMISMYFNILSSNIDDSHSLL